MCTSKIDLHWCFRSVGVKCNRKRQFSAQRRLKTLIVTPIAYPRSKIALIEKSIFFPLFKQIADFASDIGGQLGLWIGFSVLTIAEFIEFFMLLFAHLVKKCTSRGKVKSASLELKET